jgi:hypothetical protein
VSLGLYNEEGISKMKGNNVFKSIVFPFLFFQALQAWSQERPFLQPVKPVLNNEIIIKLFSDRLNEVKRHYKLNNIMFEQGGFTKAGSLEAIIGFDDENQPHATGYYEVWLLSYDNGWRIKRKLFDLDFGKFKVINIGDHERPKVWIEGGGGNQGYDNYEGKLILLADEHEDILFLTKGYNYLGAYGESDMFSIKFEDIDGDGLLEIIETRVKSKYDRIKDDIVPISQKEYVYKFNGRKYERCK